MKDGKPTGGYDRLKTKYAKLEKEVNDLHRMTSAQQTKISELTAELHNKQVDLDFAELTAKRYWWHMGWFRRWMWERKHGE